MSKDIAVDWGEDSDMDYPFSPDEPTALRNVVIKPEIREQSKTVVISLKAEAELGTLQEIRDLQKSTEQLLAWFEQALHALDSKAEHFRMKKVSRK